MSALQFRITGRLPGDHAHDVPHPVWQYRLGTFGDFTANEPLAEALSPQVRRSLAYGLLLRPIAQWPEPAARIVLKLADIAARAVAVWDRLIERIFGKLERV